MPTTRKTASANKGDADSQKIVLGLPVEGWLSAIQSVGMPALFMCFVCFMLWKYVPVIVGQHVHLLQKTEEAMDNMEKNIHESTKMIDEITTIERKTDVFMDEVHDEHTQALEDHKAIMDAIRRSITTAVDK